VRRASHAGHPQRTEAFLGMLDRLDGVLLRDPERGREELRGILGEKIKLQPDESGRFLWAEYSLGLRALLPNAEIMVAGGVLGTSSIISFVRSEMRVGSCTSGGHPRWGLLSFGGARARFDPCVEVRLGQPCAPSRGHAGKVVARARYANYLNVDLV
jgi:hypothetical protein